MRSPLSTVAILAAAGLSAPAPQPRFGARVDLLVVSAIVRNADNTLARGLTQGDFELREDGKPVTVATFAEVDVDAPTSVDDGRFVVLLLDNLASDPMLTTRIKQIAHGFADRIGPKDVMSVVYLNGSSSVTTQDRAGIKAAIDRMKPFGTSIMPSLGIGQHSMQALSSLAEQLQQLGHRRKVVVAVGPAARFNPPLHEGEVQGDTAQAIRDTARSNVTTYVIDPAGLNMGSRRRIGLANSGFIPETGGRVFADTNVYEPAIAQVWEESGSYYLLGYEPARRDNTRHDIDVRVKKPGLQVRARRIRG